MSATQVKKELSTYLPLLSDRQQEILLDMIKNILHIDKKEKHITIDQYNNELDVAMQQINEEKISTHADVLIKSEKWFTRK